MSLPPTYVVICLHEGCRQEAAQYMCDRLRRDAGLLVRQEAPPMRRDGLIFHVSANKDKLLQLAEVMGMKKKDRDGVMRRFEAASEREFPPDQRGCVVGPLTLSDVHRCVLYAVDSLHLEPGLRSLPGHPECKVMKRAPVVPAFRDAGLIDSFPLHDDETVGRLRREWRRAGVLSPPVDDIRDYFGENVALYFAFASFYTAFLVPAAILGVAQWSLERFLGVNVFFSNIAFAGLNLVAVTIFLELWKRRSNALSYQWGSGGKLRHKKPRPEFRGDPGVNPVTGEEELQYPASKTLRKVLLVSFPITFVALALAFCLMLASFAADRAIVGLFLDPETGEFSGGIIATLITYVPSTVYSVLVLLINQYYLRLAHHLTEWENHRTQEQFEKHVVAKLVVFEFTNTFLSLFYVAFWIRDAAMLRSQVTSMLVVLQLVSQVQETLLPVFLRRPSTKKMMNRVSKKLTKDPTKPVMCQHSEVSGVSSFTSEAYEVALANFSLKRDPYESTYDDFMELWLQFGHVFLFSSVYPLAAALALVNNLIELRVDAYKLCTLSRKPTPRAVRDIGAWYAAFSVTSVISVMTNCALLSADPDVSWALNSSGSWSNSQWILLFVAVEHLFLLIRVAIAKLINDVPKEVKLAMDRDEHLRTKLKKRN